VRHVLLVSALVSAVAVSAAAAEPTRHQLDRRDLELMSEASPEAARLFAEGELRLADADLKAAEEKFAEVRRLAPNSGVAARRHAQVLTELGMKQEALGACKQALQRSRTGIDGRACAAALLLGPGAPTAEEVADSMRLMTWAKRMADQPFGDAILCEIAYRIGDEGMLRHCVESLQAYAPDHYETKRFAAALPPRSGWRRGLGWMIVLGAGVVTLAAWARRRFARTARAAVPAVAGCLMLGHASLGRAETPAPVASIERVSPEDMPTDPKEQAKLRWQLSKEFPIDPRDPVGSVPSLEKANKSPLEFGYFLQDLAAEANNAEKKGEFGAAAKYWAALAKAVPDVALSYRRACQNFEKIGDLANAIDHCAVVLRLEDVHLDDFLVLERLYLAKPDFGPADVAAIEVLVKHLQESKENQDRARVAAAHVSCELGLRLEDKKRVQTCTAALSKVAPTDPRTLSFLWSYAMMRNDYRAARAAITALKKTSMPPPAIDKLEKATAEKDVWWRRPLTDWRYGLPLAAGLVFVAVLLVRRQRRGSEIHPAPSVSTA
jgi:tetratricopeptide (TPR) repeat protein